MTKGQVSLKPVEIKIPVRGLDQERKIDIGGDDLHLSVLADGLPGKQGKAGDDGMDHRKIRLIEGQRHPIAHGRKILASAC